MHTAILNEIDPIAYLGKLMSLIQLYLEFNLSVTDAMLAAESDLVTWKTLDPDFRLLSGAVGRKPDFARPASRPNLRVFHELHQGRAKA